MIEQINIALEQKSPGISQPGSLSTVRANVEKYTSNKSDEEWTSRVLPSEQDDIVNSLNYEGIAMVEVAVTTYMVSELRVGSVTD